MTKRFESAIKTLGFGCLILLLITETGGSVHARDTRPPNAPTGLTVTHYSGNGDDQSTES